RRKFAAIPRRSERAGRHSQCFHDNSLCPASAFVGSWFAGSMRVPFASFATHKLMAQALSSRKMQCGGDIALAQRNCALWVAGIAYLRLASVAGLLIQQLREAPVPTIIKQPVAFGTHTFDPAMPPTDMPPLSPGENAE